MWHKIDKKWRKMLLKNLLYNPTSATDISANCIPNFYHKKWPTYARVGGADPKESSADVVLAYWGC